MADPKPKRWRAAGARVVDSGNRVICEVPLSTRRGMKEAAGLAVMLAASPRMFAACDVVSEELDNQLGCYCELPPPGESGVIECTPCRDRRLARTLRAAAAKAVP